MASVTCARDQITPIGNRILGNDTVSDAKRVNRSNPNRRWLLQIVTSQRQGKSCLPFCLGLQPLAFIHLLQTELGQASAVNTYICCQGENRQALENGQLRQELLQLRYDEWQAVRNLLLSSCREQDHSAQRMADVVAAGCLGGDHLWRDLGLATRSELTDLLQYNFPSLAARNTDDMKWKKFFYKQLCEQQGGYVCRAPSCDQCAAYDDCFGEEV